MANEIRFPYGTTGANLYAVLADATGRYLAGATPGAFAAASWSSYALALTESGTSGVYFADFPAAPRGLYAVEVYKRAGGSPAISDSLVGEGERSWTGTAVNAGDVNVAEVLGSTANVVTAPVDANVVKVLGQDATVVTTPIDARLNASQPDYAPAKAGDAMALTSGERSTLTATIKTDTGNNTTAGSIGKQLADSYSALAAFAGLQITGVVAASPTPTTTGFTVTLDSALAAGKTAAGIAGQYATPRSGNAAAEAKAIAACIINSTTSLSLAFSSANAFSAAPAAGDAVSISA